MPGRTWERALDLAFEQHGYITFTDARDIGFDPALLRQWLERGLVERAAHGIYRFPQIPPTEFDRYMLATLWPARRGVLSHETALQLHELCDVNPDRIHITLPTGYHPRRKGGEFYVVHHEDLDDEDVTWIEGIRVVTPACAIRQAIETGVPPHLVQQAIDSARRRGRAAAEVLDDLAGRLVSGAV